MIKIEPRGVVWQQWGGWLWAIAYPGFVIHPATLVLGSAAEAGDAVRRQLALLAWAAGVEDRERRHSAERYARLLASSGIVVGPGEV